MTKAIIQTDYSRKPIPDRDYDWSARLTIFEGDDSQPEGWGATESEAVTALLQDCLSFDDGGAQDKLIELAHRGWESDQEAAS